MPSFPIVDSHVHLYDPGHLSYGWLKRVPRIDRRYDLSDLDRCRGQVEVDKIVFAEVWVDPGLHVEEAAWVQALADERPEARRHGGARARSRRVRRSRPISRS